MSQQPPNKTEDLQSLINKELTIQPMDFNLTPVPLKEVLAEISPIGDKTKLRELVGKVITIWSIEFFKGKYGLAAFITLTDPDKNLLHAVIGQKVVMQKLYYSATRLPVTCTLKFVEGGNFEGYFDIE